MPDVTPVKPTPAEASALPPSLTEEQMELLAKYMPGALPTGEQTASGPLARPQSIEDVLAKTAHNITSRYGMTGGRFNTPMPPWARNLPEAVLASPDYDPYFGLPGEGDERVFFGQKKGKIKTTVPGQPNFGPGDPDNPLFRTGGNTQPEEVTLSEKRDKTKTVQQALNLVYAWDEGEVADAMQRMRDAGLEVNDFEDMKGVWQGLVTRAAMTYSMSQGERKVTPWDVLELVKAETGAVPGGPNDPNRKEKVTYRSVSEITEGQAWSTMRGTLSQMLGRDPDDQELRDFTYRMNQLAANNPSVTETITRYKDGQAVSQTSQTDPGFTGDDMAMAAYQDAQGDEEYGAYQAATTYWNALVSALGPMGDTA